MARLRKLAFKRQRRERREQLWVAAVAQDGKAAKKAMDDLAKEHP